MSLNSIHVANLTLFLQVCHDIRQKVLEEQNQSDAAEHSLYNAALTPEETTVDVSKYSTPRLFFLHEK